MVRSGRVLPTPDTAASPAVRVLTSCTRFDLPNLRLQIRWHRRVKWPKLDTPPQRRGMNGRIPEALHLLIEQRPRHRAAGHVERGDEIADQRPRDGAAGGFDTFADVVVHQVKLG